MKIARLKKMFFTHAGLLEAGFTQDKGGNDPEFASVRRTIYLDYWQFIALSLSPNNNTFYVEAAISQAESFPLNLPLTIPSKRLKKGGLRFRANELWTNAKCFGGWFLERSLSEFECLALTDSPEDKDLLAALTQSPGNPEGVFKTYEEAFASVENRIMNWVVPFLDDFHK